MPIVNAKDAVACVRTTAHLAADEFELANLGGDEIHFELQIGHSDLSKIFVGQREEVEIVLAPKVQGDRDSLGDADLAGGEEIVSRVKHPVAPRIASGPCAVFAGDFDLQGGRCLQLPWNVLPLEEKDGEAESQGGGETAAGEDGFSAKIRARK